VLVPLAYLGHKVSLALLDQVVHLVFQAGLETEVHKDLLVQLVQEVIRVSLDLLVEMERLVYLDQQD